jgi:D-alanyl-D-alanine carboxypeptidase
MNGKLTKKTQGMRTAAGFFALILTLAWLGSSWFMPLGVHAVDQDGWPAYDEVQIESYCVIDAETGKEILSYKPDVSRANASTTKIMTALLLVEDENFDPDKLLTVSERSLIFSDPASVRIKGLKAGDQLRSADCLAALLVASANDIARVIAENYGGTFGAVDPERKADPAAAQILFVERMNKRAAELGALSTHFTNPAGFDEMDGSHYTTARDLALIAAEAMKHPLIAQACSLQYYRLPVSLDHPEAWWATLSSTNALVIYGADFLQSRYYKSYTGVKTGTTPQAGKCLVGSGITVDGRRFIAAALGINPTDMAETPLLARALPVRALLEEAARLEGAPLREDVDLLAPPPLPEESAPSESQGGSSQDQTSPSGGIEEDPFFTNAIGQTKPLILVLAALGALAIIGAIVTGITAFLIFINKWRMKSRPRGR